MLKQITVALATLALAFSVAACKPTSTTETKADGTTTTTTADNGTASVTTATPEGTSTTTQK